MLFPILTESRNIIDLNGIWNFKLDKGNGFQENWQNAKLTDTIAIMVPASEEEGAYEYFKPLVEPVQRA